MALLVGLDLWSKQAVFGWLGGDDPPVTQRDGHGHERYVLVDNWLALMLSENHGAAFGKFGEYPHVLVGGRVVAVVVLLIALWRIRRGSFLTLWGVVLVLAGAAGNLYDNLMRARDPGRPFGAVRDFIDVYFGIWDYHFPTFNVADSCITLGAVCFLVQGLFHREPEAEPPEAA